MILALLILISAFLLNLFLPWWSVALPGLALGYFFKYRGVTAFLWGFLGVFLLWAGQGLYIHLANDGILATRIAAMLGVDSPLVVVVVTGLIGGLVSGFATLTSSLFTNKTGEV